MAPKIERTTPKAKNNDYVITYSTGAKKWTNDRPGDGVGDLEDMLDDLGVQRGLSAISKAIETGKGLKPAVDGMIRDTGTDKGQTVLNAVYKGMKKSKATDKKIEGWGNARKMVGNVRDVVKKIFKVFPVNKATEIAERLIKFNKTKDKKYDLTKEEQKKIYNRVDYGETLPLTKKRKIDIGWTDHGEYRSDLRDINPHEINEAITDKLKNRLNPPQKNTVKLKERGVGTMVVDFDTKKKPADATVVTVYGSDNLRDVKSVIAAVMDRVDPENMEALWYENEAGDKFYPDLSDNGYPDIPEGYIYQHFQDSALSHSILKITQKDEVDTCDHPIDFMKVDHGLIPGLEGEKCEKCGGSRQRNVGDEWPEWEANGSQSVMTMNSGWPEDLVAAMSAEGVPLNKAIMIAGNSCERCMNSLADEFGLDWGYPEMSDEWKETRTECEYCKGLGFNRNGSENFYNNSIGKWSKKMGNDDLANEVLKLADSLVADEYSDKRDRNVKYLEKKDKERKDEKKKKSLKKMNDKLLKRKESEGWTDEEYQKHKKRKETQLSKGDASPDVIEDIAKPAIKKVKKVIDKFRGKGKSKDKSKPKGKDEFTKSEWNDYKKKHPDTKIRPKIVGSIADRVAMSFSENKDLEDKFEKEVEKSKKLSGVDANIAKYLVESGLDDGDPSDDKISVSKKSVGASKLKPSQTTIRVDQVVGMALGMLKSGKIGGNLGALISGDNHILDGHHRWAAAILAGGSSPKVGGYQASMAGKDLIKVLNIMTKGEYGRQKGNAGSGNIADVNPGKVRKLLEKYVDKGVSGEFPVSADGVKKILEKGFGSVEKAIDEMSSNAKRVSKQVPSWAQNRTDMPVIKPNETGGAASLLNQGKVNWSHPFTNPNSDTPALSEKVAKNFVALATRPNWIPDGMRYKLKKDLDLYFDSHTRSPTGTLRTVKRGTIVTYDGTARNGNVWFITPQGRGKSLSGHIANLITDKRIECAEPRGCWKHSLSKNEIARGNAGLTPQAEKEWSKGMMASDKDMADRVVSKFSSISDRLVTASEMESYCSDCAEKIASGEMEMTWGELREFLED